MPPGEQRLYSGQSHASLHLLEGQASVEEEEEEEGGVGEGGRERGRGERGRGCKVGVERLSRGERGREGVKEGRRGGRG